MTRFGVMKHLRVLEKAGLVVARRSGREKLKADLEEETNMPETQLYELFIRATPEKLWQALTDGAVTRRYFFGETIHGDFRKGSPWHCTGASGKRDVEGTVLESDPPRKLSITWHVLYDEALTKELSKVTYQDGWQLVLSSLETLMETGESMPVPAEAS